MPNDNLDTTKAAKKMIIENTPTSGWNENCRNDDALPDAPRPRRDSFSAVKVKHGPYFLRSQWGWIPTNARGIADEIEILTGCSVQEARDEVERIRDNHLIERVVARRAWVPDGIFYDPFSQKRTLAQFPCPRPPIPHPGKTEHLDELLAIFFPEKSVRDVFRRWLFVCFEQACAAINSAGTVVPPFTPLVFFAEDVLSSRRLLKSFIAPIFGSPLSLMSCQHHLCGEKWKRSAAEHHIRFFAQQAKLPPLPTLQKMFLPTPGVPNGIHIFTTSPEKEPLLLEELDLAHISNFVAVSTPVRNDWKDTPIFFDNVQNFVGEIPAFLDALEKDFRPPRKIKF